MEIIISHAFTTSATLLHILSIFLTRSIGFSAMSCSVTSSLSAYSFTGRKKHSGAGERSYLTLPLRYGFHTTYTRDKEYIYVNLQGI